MCKKIPLFIACLNYCNIKVLMYYIVFNIFKVKKKLFILFNFLNFEYPFYLIDVLNIIYANLILIFIPSEESKTHIQDIFSQIEQLKIEEKLLLYLKLPLSLTNTGGTVDPLRQPLNPLGNRYEIHQTIMWIKTHLEEDPDVSLPKQEVYDEYK